MDAVRFNHPRPAGLIACVAGALLLAACGGGGDATADLASGPADADATVTAGIDRGTGSAVDPIDATQDGLLRAISLSGPGGEDLFRTAASGESAADAELPARASKLAVSTAAAQPLGSGLESSRPAPTLSISGTTYYVDSRTGSDSNDGRSAIAGSNGQGPWRSLARVASATLRAGDGVRLACGASWHESLRLAVAGTATAPIVIGAQPAGCADKPLIHGGAAIAPSAWTPVGGNIYRTRLAGTPLQIASAMGAHMLAHHPNHGARGGWTDSPYAAIAANAPVVSGKSPSFTVGSDLALPAGATIGAGTQVRVRVNPYLLHETTVSAASGSSLTLATPSPYPLLAGWGYTLAGQRWMLDSVGEWHHDPATGTLDAWMPNGGAPSATVNVALRDYGIDLDGSKYVAVDGLAIRHARVAINMVRSTGSSVRNSALEDLASHAVTAAGSSGVLVQANTIARTGRDAISANNDYLAPGTGLRVVDNTIAESGVRWIGGRIMSLPLAQRAAVRTGVNATITGNSLQHTGYLGIWAEAGSLVSDNLIQNGCLVLDDCGAVYASGAGNGSRIIHNLIGAMRGSIAGKPAAVAYTQAQGIFLDESASGVLVEGNTVTEADSGIHVHVASRNTLRGNKLYGNRRQQLWLQETRNREDAQGDLSGNTITGNQFAATTPASRSLYLSSTIKTTYRFGSFDANRYLDSVSPTAAIEYAPAIGHNTYAFARWREAASPDGTTRNIEPNGSASSQVRMASSIITGASIVPNGRMSGSAAGWSTWNLSAPRGSLLRESCAVGWCGRYLTGGSPGLVSTPNFSIVGGTWYRLTLDLATGADKQFVNVVVRRGGGGSNTYERLSDRVTDFTANRSWTRYSVVFKATKTVNVNDPATQDLGARIDLQGIEPGTTVMVANVELVPVLPTEALSRTALLSNPGRDPVQVACPLAGAEAPLCGSFLRLTDLAPVSWPQLLQGRSTEIIYTRDSTLVDSDGDGIVDSQDRCAASPAGRAVDSAGCAIGQG